MTNLEKATDFLSKVFNGPDARIEPLSQELAKLFDQCEEEGKVKLEAELLHEDKDAEKERAHDRSPQAADDDVKEPVKHGAPSKTIFSGKPQPKKK